MAVDRLTVQDLGMLWPDDFDWPQDIGVIAVLDGTGLLDAAGRVRIGVVRDAISGRLHRVPRLRQVVHRPRWGLGRPLWVDGRRSPWRITSGCSSCRHLRTKPSCCGRANTAVPATARSVPPRCGSFGCCPACPMVGWGCS